MGKNLQIELLMNKGFNSLEQEALLSLFRSYSTIEPKVSHIFQQHKLTSPQFNILRILLGQKEGKGMSCAEISKRMINRDSDLTRLLDKLEKAGFVKRERPAHDRRKVLVSITEEGVTLVKKITPELNQAEKSMCSHLSNSKLQQLIDLLGELRAPHLG
jgi:DNA-binding MarR family transcriptional regulator